MPPHVSAGTRGPTAANEGPGVIRRFVLPMIFVIGLFVALFLRRPDTTATPPVWIFTGPTMGTTYTVKVVPPQGAQEDKRARIETEVKETLTSVNNAASTYKADSELSTFNAAASTDSQTLSPMLVTIVGEALRLSTLSDGAFDVTVGPLVNAWGFGPDKVGQQPSDAELAELQKRIGFAKLTLDPDKRLLTKQHPNMFVDLSAIAKGYGVDQIAVALDGLGYVNYMVEVGGEVRARGHNPDGNLWRIGIEKPDETARAVQEVVSLDNMSLATSGNYRNFYEKDGVRIAHTIHPTTGRPVTHRLASVSVLHPSCMSADGIATTLNVLGEDAGYTLAVAQKWAALFIVKSKDGTFVEKTTPAFNTMRQRKTAD